MSLRAAIASIAALCVTLAGCGGGADDTPPGRQAKVAAAPVQQPAPDRPVFPKVDRRERARLKRDGLVRRAPRQLRKACTRVAAQTAWTVVCPTRVPGGRLAVTQFGVTGTSTDFSDGYHFSVNSGALHEPGAPDPGHWTFAAGTPPAMRDQVNARGRSAPLSRRRLRIGGVRVTRYQEPEFGDFPGVYGGHVVYEWSRGHAVLQVSVHNETHERVLRGLVRLLSPAPDPTPPAGDQVGTEP
jgi:hypothetical protein